MTNTKENADTRKRWVRPAVEKIAAGQAELGPRSAQGDGAFTAS